MSYTCDYSCLFDNDRSKEHLLHHIKNGIPTKLYEYERDIIPCRADFIEEKYSKAVQKLIDGQNALPFHATTYEEYNDYVDCGKCSRCEANEYCRSRIKEYRILCFGTLPDGSRAAVVLTDIDVYVDVEIDITNIYDGRYISSEELRGYPFKGFSHIPKTYYRISFTCLDDRKDFIEWARKGGHATYSDDRQYLHLVLRTHPIASAGWNILAGAANNGDCGYQCIDHPNISNVQHVFQVPIIGMVKMRKNMIARMQQKEHVLLPHIHKPRKLLGCWDIETYSNAQAGMPLPADEGWNIFTVSMAFGWNSYPDTLFDISLTDVDLEVHDKSGGNMNPGTVVVCKTERNILDMIAFIESRMNPDIRSAFNGGNFDWPMVLEKVKRESAVSSGFFMDFYRQISSYNRKGANEAATLKYQFKDKKVKIDAETSHTMSTVCFAPGCLDTDCLVVFKKLYPRAEIGLNGSLNYFLKLNGLEPKVDLPYLEMFKYYENALNGAADAGQQMLNVVYYCLVDAKSIFRLYNKRTIIVDSCNLANISSTPLFDSFYSADGMRVTNTVGKYTGRFNEFYSSYVNKNAKKIKYPGAKVIKPIRGVCKFPVVGDDFSSMYPHMHINFNISTDRIVLDEAYANQLRDMGYNIYYSGVIYCTEEETGNTFPVQAWFVRHNEVINIKKINDLGSVEEYPDNEARITTSFIKITTVTFNNGDKYVYEKPIEFNIQEVIEEPLTPELTYDSLVDNEDKLLEAAAKHLGKTVEELGGVKSRKYAYKNVYGRKRLPCEHIGIFGYILKKLFDKRVPIKNALVQLTNVLEIMTKQSLTEYEFEYDGRKVKWDLAELNFNIAKVDSVQKAIKVLCNTFYGTSGFNLSPIYMLEIASSVTAKGRMVLTMAEQLTIHYGHTVVYGDTDSIYMHINPMYFDAYMKKYNATEQEITNALEYGEITSDEYEKRRRSALYELWSAMIHMTMKIANRLLEHTSDYMIGRTGSLRFKMAYEEVLAPFVSCGRKKYFGTPHYEDINFEAKEFVRGLDFIKQGATPLAKELGLNVVNQLRSIYNTKSAHDIVFEQINSLFSKSWSDSYFTSHAKYKPNKQNVRVHRFHERMNNIHQLFTELNDYNMAQLFRPPHPTEKFEYLVMQKEDGMTLSGAIKKASAGDKMEYTNVYNYFKSYRECPYPQNIEALSIYNMYNNLNIDVFHYLKSSLSKILARFISHEARFVPEDVDQNTDYKRFDELSIKAAADYLLDYAKTLQRRPVNNSIMVRKNEFKRIKSITNSNIKSKCGSNAAKLISVYTPKASKILNSYDTVMSKCDAIAESSVPENYDYKAYINAYIENHGGDVKKAFNDFIANTKLLTKYNTIRKNECIEKLRSYDKNMIDNIHKYYADKLNTNADSDDMELPSDNIAEWAHCVETIIEINICTIVRDNTRKVFTDIVNAKFNIIDSEELYKAVMSRIKK